MAFGDVWQIDDPDPKWGSVCTLVELCPHPKPADWPSSVVDGRAVVTAIVVSGFVRYMDRVLGVGETGPLIPQESKTVRRVAVGKAHEYPFVGGPLDGHQIATRGDQHWMALLPPTFSSTFEVEAITAASVPAVETVAYELRRDGRYYLTGA